MHRKTLIGTGAALVAGTALALASALPASAHVTVSASSTAAGSSALLSFTLPHGCDGSPTTSVDIALPEEIVAATPTVLAGWEVEKVMEPLSSPGTDAHGNEVSERVGHVVYTSTTGGLPDGYRAQFDLQLTLPDLPAGTELGFPVVQGCAEGEEVWDGEALPAITLSESTGGGHGHGAEEPGHDAAAEDGAAEGSAGTDVLARVLGVAGLAVGAAGLTAAVLGPAPGHGGTMRRVARAAGLGALGALGLALAVLGVAAPAQAHNWIVSSTPAEGETLTALPESFEIRTNDALLDLGGGGQSFAFLVQDAAGLYYGDGCVRVVGPSMFTDAALGAPGAYTVSWQFVSADGHTLSGSYGFDWAPADGAGTTEGSAERPRCGAESPPADGAGSEVPPADDGGSGGAVPAELWWIAGAVAAVAIAVAATLLLGRRRTP